MQNIFEKNGCHGNVVVPGPFNGYHEMKHITQQSLVRIGILEPKGRTDFLMAV